MRRTLTACGLVLLILVSGSVLAQQGEFPGVAQDRTQNSSNWSAARKFKSQFGTTSKHFTGSRSSQDNVPETSARIGPPRVVVEGGPTDSVDEKQPEFSTPVRRVGSVGTRTSTRAPSARRVESERQSSRRAATLVPQAEIAPANQGAPSGDRSSKRNDAGSLRTLSARRSTASTDIASRDDRHEVDYRAERAERETHRKSIARGADDELFAERRTPTRPPRSIVNRTDRRESQESTANGDELLISRQSPLLSVETLGPRETKIGKESIFRIRLQNLGDADAASVVVRVTTPQSAEIVSAQASRGATETPSGRNAEPLEWRVDRIGAQSAETLTLRIIPRTGEAFDLDVAWMASPIDSQVSIQVQEPQLAIRIEGPSEVRYGHTEIYELQVSNPGTGTAEDVELKLMPLEGGDQPMAVQKIGKIEAGEKKVLEVELTARQSGYLNVQAVVVAEGLAAEATERVLVRRAGLTVEAAGPQVKYAGTVATYRFRVANPGNVAATNIEIVATLPPGAEYIDCSRRGHFDEESGHVVWTVESLSAQDDQIFQVTATLSGPGGNVFRVAAEAANELAASGSATTQVETLADLKLEVSDPRGPLPTGEEMVYEIRITNRGTKAAQDVDAIAFFSQGIEPIAVKGGSHRITSGRVVFDKIPTLGVGDEIVYKIVAKAARGGNHVFRAEVQCEKSGERLAAEETTHFYDNGTVTARKPESSFSPPTRSSKLPAPGYRMPR